MKKEMKPPEEFAPLRTQREVAEILGLSRGRVHQIEKDALAKIREELQIYSDPIERKS